MLSSQAIEANGNQVSVCGVRISAAAGRLREQVSVVVTRRHRRYGAVLRGRPDWSKGQGQASEAEQQSGTAIELTRFSAA